MLCLVTTQQTMYTLGNFDVHCTGRLIYLKLFYLFQGEITQTISSCIPKDDTFNRWLQTNLPQQGQLTTSEAVAKLLERNKSLSIEAFQTAMDSEGIYTHTHTHTHTHIYIYPLLR